MRTSGMNAYMRHVQEDGSTPQEKQVANPLLEGLDPQAFVLRALQRVRAAELEQALLMLPFNDALRLLGYLPSWLSTASQVPVRPFQAIPVGDEATSAGTVLEKTACAFLQCIP